MLLRSDSWNEWIFKQLMNRKNTIEIVTNFIIFSLLKIILLLFFL